MVKCQNDNIQWNSVFINSNFFINVKLDFKIITYSINNRKCFISSNLTRKSLYTNQEDSSLVSSILVHYIFI